MSYDTHFRVGDRQWAWSEIDNSPTRYPFRSSSRKDVVRQKIKHLQRKGDHGGVVAWTAVAQQLSRIPAADFERHRRHEKGPTGDAGPVLSNGNHEGALPYRSAKRIWLPKCHSGAQSEQSDSSWILCRHRGGTCGVGALTEVVARAVSAKTVMRDFSWGCRDWLSNTVNRNPA